MVSDAASDLSLQLVLPVALPMLSAFGRVHSSLEVGVGDANLSCG
jgi:hypothetical protein